MNYPEGYPWEDRGESAHLLRNPDRGYTVDIETGRLHCRAPGCTVVIEEGGVREMRIHQVEARAEEVGKLELARYENQPYSWAHHASESEATGYCASLYDHARAQDPFPRERGPQPRRSRLRLWLAAKWDALHWRVGRWLA